MSVAYYYSPKQMMVTLTFSSRLVLVVTIVVEHIIKRGKLVVSGGVTRGRDAYGAIGMMTPKDMTPQAQAQNQPKEGPGTRNRNREGGLSPFWGTN